MIKCPFCRTLHVDNTIFCSECGNYLLKDSKRETDPLGMDAIDWLGEAIGGPRTARVPQPGSRPVAVRLKIGASRREVELPLNKIIHLGRVDAAADLFPEVDLTDDEGLKKGVSRRHARILTQERAVLVEDLGSANGTFINGKRLAPYLLETLNDGDNLQLGRLSIEVKIQKEEKDGRADRL